MNKKEKQKYELFKCDFEKSKYFEDIIGNKICSNKFLEYNSLPFFICAKLKKIIKEATHVVLQKRYQSTSEFMKDIHKYMSSSVNWQVHNDSIIAVKQKKIFFKIIEREGKYIVQKKCSNCWKNYNKIKGTKEEIANQINSV